MALPNRLHQSDERRTVERTTLGRRGVLRLPDSRSIEVTVLDLTRDGCRVETGEPVPAGTNVEIGIGNLGRMKASVMWRSDDGLGCAFDTPLPPGAITAALGPSNIVSFPAEAAAEVAGAPAIAHAGKFKPRTRLMMLVGATALSWIAVGGLIVAVI